ncbi:MAG: Crp/Fnr family transcriptional regulator [Flavobacteriales bacterium]|nr:Crp/Fnr family transcriptional regulator [Flavobacteriales bacterium]
MESVLEKIVGAVALERYLRNIVDFSDEEMDIIMSHFEPMQLPTNEYFVDEGLVCDRIGFLTKGYVRCYYEINDTEVTTMVLGKHNIITSHTSFTLQRPSIVYVEALADCELLTLSYESMQELYQQFPKWERLGRLITEQVYGYMESRVVDYLCLSAEERYVKMLREDDKLLKNVPLRYIASMLGITPETLSRIRKKIHKG